MMPLRDWSRVDAGILHDFHITWISDLQRILNGGLLPEGYYALIEPHAGQTIPDVLTLLPSTRGRGPEPARSPRPRATAGVAVADAPPRTRRRHTVDPVPPARRRSLAIRHVSGHRLVALVEIVSPA